MNAVFCSGIEDGPLLTFGTAPEPQLAENMVLVRVELVSIEAIDLIKLALYRHGLAEPPPGGIVGCQASGTVEGIGAQVTRFRLGDRVVAYHACGSHAELFVAPEASTWHLPEGLDPGSAAAAPFTLAATRDTLCNRGRLRAGETILINHVTSSLGLMTVQLALETGAKVIGIARDPACRDRLRKIGLTEILSATRDDVMARCLELTQGRGVDFVFDVSAGERTADLARLVVPGGRYAAFSVIDSIADQPYGPDGAAPDATGPELERLPIMTASPMHDPAVHAQVGVMMGRIAKGELQLPIEHEFALCEAAEAYDFILHGRPFGHVVMRP
ncbi:zinc-binding alcohol dehydrogenase family protein [Novosphingobium sp. ZW T3_23]|uniref:quinone oxidoreductase family protein n=1 Tax=Novosphingobium sp. ZW T3_23 TaxID=3378084 RepID=UPI0038550532